ncbi:unnamed protein product [Ixodes pacificus]
MVSWRLFMGSCQLLAFYACCFPGFFFFFSQRSEALWEGFFEVIQKFHMNHLTPWDQFESSLMVPGKFILGFLRSFKRYFLDVLQEHCFRVPCGFPEGYFFSCSSTRALYYCSLWLSVFLFEFVQKVYFTHLRLQELTFRVS